MGSILCVPLFTIENIFPLLFSWRKKNERGEKRMSEREEEKKSETEEKKKVCIEINTEVSFQTK